MLYDVQCADSNDVYVTTSLDLGKSAGTLVIVLLPSCLNYLPMTEEGQARGFLDFANTCTDIKKSWYPSFFKCVGL